MASKLFQDRKLRDGAMIDGRQGSKDIKRI